MAQGTGLPLPQNQRVLLRPQQVIPAGEAAASAATWGALARAGATLTDIGADVLEKMQLQARAKSVSDFELARRRENTEAQVKYRFDPEGYKNWAQSTQEGALGEAPAWQVDHARVYLGELHNNSYAQILNQTVARNERLASDSLKARLKSVDGDVVSLAMAGKDNTPDFQNALTTYDGVLATGTESGLWTAEQADLERQDLTARAQGEAAAQRALAVSAEQGHEKAIEFLRKSVLENETISLSPSQRRRIFNAGVSALNLQRQQTQAEREAAIASSRDLRATLKTNPGAVDPGETQQLLDELRRYGAAGEYHRLASQASVATALAPFQDGSVPLGDFARHIENLRSEAGSGAPSELRPVLDEAAAATSVSPSYLYRLARKESGFNPEAKSTTSTAAGIAGFTDATWKAMLEKYGPQFGLSPSTPKSDPRASALMAGMLAQENANVLEDAGLALTPSNLYVAHFSGAAGAVKLLKADPNASAADILPDAAKANRSIFYDQDGRARSISEMLGTLTSGFAGVNGLPSNGEVTREAQKLFVEQARKFWPDFQQGLARGQTPSGDDLQAVQYAASISGDAKWQSEVNAALKAAGVAPMMAAAPAAQTQAELDRVREQYAEGGWTVDELTTFKAVEDQFALQQKALSEDPIGFAVRFRGAHAPDPLDFASSQGLANALAQRVTLAGAVADGQGLAEIPAVSAGDRASIVAAIATPNLPPEQKAAPQTASDKAAFDFLAAIPDRFLMPTLRLKDVNDAIAGAVRSKEPGKFNAAMAFVSDVWARAPLEAASLFKDDVISTMQDWQAKLRYYSPQELAEYLRSNDDPQVIARRKEVAIEGQKLAPAKTVEALTAELAPPGFFTPPWVSNAPVDPRTADAALADYTALFADRFAVSRDANKAHQQAIEKMRLYWSRSEVNNGRLTLYAPESRYPELNKSHEWMKVQLERDLTARLGQMPDDYAVVADRTTESEVVAGLPPTYLIVAKNNDGEWDMVRTGSQQRPFRYQWNPGRAQSDARARFEQQRARIFEGRSAYEGIVPAL